MQSSLPDVNMAMRVSQPHRQQHYSFSSANTEQQQQQQQRESFGGMSTTAATLSLSSITISSAFGSITTEPASETAIDAFATKLLDHASPPDTIVDSNLGNYVTTMLRCANITDFKSELTSFEEYESLLELLEDQCHLERNVAKSVLEDIAQAVVTRQIPSSGHNMMTTTTTTTVGNGLYAGGSLDSFQSLKSSLPPIDTATTTTNATAITPLSPSSNDTTTDRSKIMGHADLSGNGGDLSTTASGTSSSSTATLRVSGASLATTPSSSGPIGIVPSPLQDTTLIPIDLMGALDDPSPHNTHQVIQQDQGFSSPRYHQHRDYSSPLPTAPQLSHMHRRPASGQKQQQKQLYIQQQQEQEILHYTLQQPQHHQFYPHHQYQHFRTPPPHQQANEPALPPLPSSTDDFPPLGISTTTKWKKDGDDDNNNDDAFPPLGAASTKSFSDTSAKPKRARGGGTSTKKKTSQAKNSQKTDETKELAAALFRPARPRQNSITETGSSACSNNGVSGSVGLVVDCDSSSTGTGVTSLSYQQRARGSSLGQCSENSATTNTSRSVTGTGTANNNIYYQYQINSCTEILLSMVQDLGEEAAIQAAYMSDGDFNIAHYIVDSAMTAPPVCRHILHGGCYRSDCQFSHDVDGHSCLFWLRGRCSKNSSCQFLHGFNAKLLENIPKGVLEAAAASSQRQMPSAIYPLTTDQMQTYNPTNGSMMVPPGYSDAYHPQYLPARGQSLHDEFPLPSAGSNNSYSSSGLRRDENAGQSQSSTTLSFANVASKGYSSSTSQFVDHDNHRPSSTTRNGHSIDSIPTVRIPQDLWNPHENRDASVFHIPDPLERYQQVAATVQRHDVIDLHFQSMKTFQPVLAVMLPTKFEQEQFDEVWIVTGTGHHVGTKTHQKGGGALEGAVIRWLIDEGYNFARGKDSNGLCGAILVKKD